MPTVRTVAVLALVLAGCGGEDDMPGLDGADTPDRVAMADAAERTGVDTDQVRVVRHEAVTWPDGSLGCPQADQFYTQALVEGYRIVVEVDGQHLHYHGRDGGPPVYCAHPQPPVGGDPLGTVDR